MGEVEVLEQRRSFQILFYLFYLTVLVRDLQRSRTDRLNICEIY